MDQEQLHWRGPVGPGGFQPEVRHLFPDVLKKSIGDKWSVVVSTPAPLFRLHRQPRRDSEGLGGAAGLLQSASIPSFFHSFNKHVLGKC